MLVPEKNLLSNTDFLLKQWRIPKVSISFQKTQARKSLLFCTASDFVTNKNIISEKIIILTKMRCDKIKLACTYMTLFKLITLANYCWISVTFCVWREILIYWVSESRLLIHASRWSSHINWRNLKFKVQKKLKSV